jgi:hypothetical protein
MNRLQIVSVTAINSSAGLGAYVVMKPMSGRAWLLGGVSVLAVNAVLPPARAQMAGAPSGVSISLEGGEACSFGGRGTFTANNPTVIAGYSVPSTATTRFGNHCGWTGRFGIFQQAPQSAFFGNADYWGLFVRHMDSGKQSFSPSGNGYKAGFIFPKYSSVAVPGTFKEERTVVDFEVGRNLGIGSPAVNLRAFGGIRYARYQGTLNTPVAFTGKYNGTLNAVTKDTFEGAGPRFGLSGRGPIAGIVGFTFSGSGSAIVGNDKIDVTGGAQLSRSRTQWVFNTEGEAGLTFALGKRGAELVSGVRAEAWFNQSGLNNVTTNVTTGSFAVSGSRLDRNDWGPFLRLTVPITGPP